jgi:hypothetical protein
MDNTDKKYMPIIEYHTYISWPCCPFFFNLWSGTLGTAATTGLLYQPRMIVMVIVEKLVEWRLAGET